MKYKTADDRLIRVGEAYEYWKNKADTVPKYNDAKILRNMLDEVPSAKANNDIEEWKAWFCISETLVDVSKMHMTADEGIRKIRDIMQRFEPGRRPGYWILKEDGWYCSTCRLLAPFDCDPEEKGIPYCPNCGAKMKRIRDE